MNAVGRLGSYISRGVYTVSGPFHPFGGCVDIIVVEQPDGTFKSSPWYVRFGKFQGVLKTREKVVNICVNGSDPPGLHMYLDHKGEAYFLREVDDVAAAAEDAAPGMSSGDDDEEDDPAAGLVPRSQSCSSEVAGPVRTNSRRAQILGLVFGRRNEPGFGGPDAEIIRRADSLERAELAADLLEVKWSTNLSTKKPITTTTKENGPRVDPSTEGPVPAVLQICPTKESFIYCESSESSVVMRDSSSQQTCETMFISGGESGEVRVRSEVVRARTEPQSEDTVVEHLLEDYKLEVPPNESLGNVVETCIQTDTTSNEVLSQDVCANSGLGNSFIQSEVEVNTEIDGPNKDLQSSSGTNRPPSVDSEEEQLLFGDIEEFNIGVNEASEKSPEIVEDLNMSVDKNDRSHLSPENLCDEIQPLDFSSTAENFRVSSNPIAISGANKVVVVDEEVGRLTESLPNIWSKMDDCFGSDGMNCLSHSLDSPKIPNWVLETKVDNPNSIQLEEDKAQQLISELSDTNGAEDKKITVDDLQSTPTIEISLCKHLFYEGMGFEAASRAFDAEKLSFEKFSSLGSEITKDDRLVVRINGSYYPWDSAGPLVLGMVSFGPASMFDLKGKISVDPVEKALSVDHTLNSSLSPGGNWKLWPFLFSRSRSRKAMQISVPSDIGKSGHEIGSEVSVEVVEDKNSSVGPKNVKKTVRALSPTSEQLASLNLKEGRNSVTFTFLTPMLGKQQVDCRIYLWKWNTRIVISDVDGTITRSDVLGQFMPLVGVDWSHLGVAHLFSAIKENGYQMLFLSARAISQAYITRQFLLNLKQDGKALPDGPVVISPDGLFPSLYREVIRRAPHEFKIACLEEIRSLFPSDCNPFYAGFGNRDTDEVSYLKVGIPKGKIFIINPKGEVVVNRRVDTKSYKSIHALVNGMFPPTASSEQEDFNQWNFWKLPPQIIDE